MIKASSVCASSLVPWVLALLTTTASSPPFALGQQATLHPFLPRPGESSPTRSSQTGIAHSRSCRLPFPIQPRLALNSATTMAQMRSSTFSLTQRWKAQWTQLPSKLLAQLLPLYSTAHPVDVPGKTGHW